MGGSVGGCRGRRRRNRKDRGRKTEERAKERDRAYRSVGVGSIWDWTLSQTQSSAAGTLWYASEGENRGMFTLYSSFASLIHFHFSFHPRPCLFKEFFLSPFFSPFLALTSFIFSLCFSLVSVSLSVFSLLVYSSGWLISILSVHIIDSSCLPLVKMSFIILCDSWLAGWLAG